jgi:kynureninase
MTVLTTQFENSREFAKRMDQEDELKYFRERFKIPSHGHDQATYFLGNSLGLQPRSTEEYIARILDDWERYGVEAFFVGADPWLDYHEKLAEPLSAIVGARPAEIVVMNQLTVNLHLMMVSFYQPHGKKNKILCEARAFPSDQYMLESQCRFHGLDPETTIIEVGPRKGEELIRMEDILQKIEDHKDELAIVLWGGLNYYTGQYFDIGAIATAAHDAGAVVGIDFAHGAGNIPLHLHDWDIDFAGWCSYKYLNSGPGAIAGAFIHERYHGEPVKRFAGWWGYRKETRFKMEKGFVPMDSAEGWQLSTPSPLLYATHLAALEIFDEAGMEKLRNKSIRLTGFLQFLLEELNRRSSGEHIRVITPREIHRKGCQISLVARGHGRKIYDELMREGFFVDWREPDVIRLAPVPLYNRFEEVWRFVVLLEEVLHRVTR